MFQWHSLMKTIVPNLPLPKLMFDSLSESKDGGEDKNDDDGADEWYLGLNDLFCAPIKVLLVFG